MFSEAPVGYPCDDIIYHKRNEKHATGYTRTQGYPTAAVWAAAWAPVLGYEKKKR